MGKLGYPWKADEQEILIVTEIFNFWCRVCHEKWATRIRFNYLPITQAAHYSCIYSKLSLNIAPCPLELYV